MKKCIIICSVFAVVLFLFSSGVGAGAVNEDGSSGDGLKLYKKAAYIMGSILEISVYSGEDKKAADNAIDLAFSEVGRLDMLMSNYKSNSELNRINNAVNKREPERCDDELLRVIELSAKFSRLTNGAFDITVSPLVALWGFNRGNDGDIKGYVPSKRELARVLPSISYLNIVITDAKDSNDRRRLIHFKNNFTRMDLGAIGKGYAVDRAAEVLKKAGIDSALVNFAGNIFAFGTPEGRGTWKIGLKDPVVAGNILGSFKIGDGMAVATSGNYERFFVMDGKKYTHIIDPRTGYPVRGTLSVTIIADTATTADALSTGVFVLGAEDGMKLIKSMDNVEGAIIYETYDGNIAARISDGMNKILELSETAGKIKIEN